MFGKKQLFVFDLDGTLFNTLGDLAPAVNYALRHFGLPEHDTEKIRSFIGNGSMKLVERSMGDAALPQNMAQSGIHIADVHRVYTDFYWEHCTENTTPNPHILEFLKGTDARCAVLTNKPLAPTLKIFKKFGIENRFEQILCGDTTPERKPSPAGLLQIVAKTGVATKNVVMIGDDTPDIMAARNAGVDCITLLCGFGKKENLLPLHPECSVQSFEALYELLKVMCSKIKESETSEP